MSSCDDVRALLGSLLDGELEDRDALEIRQHLDGCSECAELAEALEMVSETVAPVRELEPPAHLAEEIASNPCRRWLGLLFSAVDREIPDYNLQRLLSHLEGCPSCRETWNDLTLIHQVSEAMKPPTGLLERCITAWRRTSLRPILGRRAATAAAYVLAVSASLTIGNPVSIARSPVVQRVAEVVTTEVSEAAEEGQGELRVMAWRIWNWGNRQLAAARDLLQTNEDTTDTETNQGDRS
jgi:anti-sigma factor RsiW